MKRTSRETTAGAGAGARSHAGQRFLRLRLLAKGKPKKLALIAVMRKLLSYLNALMKKHLQQIEIAC